MASTKDPAWPIKFVTSKLKGIEGIKDFEVLLQNFLNSLAKAIQDPAAFLYALAYYKTFLAPYLKQIRKNKGKNMFRDACNRFSNILEAFLVGKPPPPPPSKKDEKKKKKGKPTPKLNSKLQKLFNDTLIKGKGCWGEVVLSWLFLNYFATQKTHSYATGVEENVVEYYENTLGNSSRKTGAPVRPGKENLTPDFLLETKNRLVVGEVKSSQSCLVKGSILKKLDMQLESYMQYLLSDFFTVRLVVRVSQNFVPGTHLDFEYFLRTGKIPVFKIVDKPTGFVEKPSLYIKGDEYRVFEKTIVCMETLGKLLGPKLAIQINKYLGF